MELRLDVLLNDLRDRPEEILAAIDRDPLLVKRASGGLVLANPSKALYTPGEQHQLYGKGIVYRRDPYRLVSLPLVKLYNLGERDVTVQDLARLAAGDGVRVRFLRKLDGVLVQAFHAEGRAWLTTRGMIEGAVTSRAEGGGPDFAYLDAARTLAGRKYPRLLDDPAALQGRTLVFEFLHPEARIITDYGDRVDLVLLAAFDQQRCRYAPYDEVRSLADRLGLQAVEALAPRGATLAEQIEDVLASLAGTDQEGTVINLERGDEVIYRVKVKSPDYLRLLRAAALCTYDRAAALLDANPQVRCWEEYAQCLRERGSDEVPEELLGFYREHYERHAAYLADCEALRAWAERTAGELLASLSTVERADPRAWRKAFAALATGKPHSGLLFAAADARLDLARVRSYVTTPREARKALDLVGQVCSLP